MLKTAFLVVLLFVLSAIMNLHRLGDKLSNWPTIRPLSWSGNIDLLGAPTLISIQSVDGVILYRLYCSSRLAPPEPEWLTQGDNYGGDFDCLLSDSSPGTPAARATLLNYDPHDLSPYHSNLASFSWSELLGNCWNNPEWGADRTFYLRGMKLRIHVVAVKVEFYKDAKQEKTYPIIRSVTAKISAEPDKNANTELARPPAQSEPVGCLQ